MRQTKRKVVRGWKMIGNQNARKYKTKFSLKGCALLDEKEEFVEARKISDDFAHVVWEHEFEDMDFSIVPCTITYEIPKKKI